MSEICWAVWRKEKTGPGHTEKKRQDQANGKRQVQVTGKRQAHIIYQGECWLVVEVVVPAGLRSRWFGGHE